MNYITFDALLHVTLTKIVKDDDYELHFYYNDTDYFRMYHEQNCCESVYIEEIHGDLDNLIGVPILYAEESTKDFDEKDGECGMWTFYKLATVKGWVDIRWMGVSEYYSVNVSLEEVKASI